MMRFVMAASLLVLSSCSAVSGEPLPSSANDPAMRTIAEQLNDEERGLLFGYLMRREMAKTFGGASLNDGVETVGDALDAQRSWAEKLSEGERKAEALKVETEQKRKAVADQISRTITVAFVDASYEPSSFSTGRYEDFEEFTFAVQNGGQKPVKAVKGEAVFFDAFGDESVRVPLRV